MRCMMCESISLTHICTSCQKKHLTPTIYKRKLQNSIDVISFYKYTDIKKLLLSKHTNLGYYMFHILAQNSFKRFADEFVFDTKLASIAIDDNIKSGYSHTAILNKHLNSRYIKPLYNKLIAKNTISYSGKSKEFRVKNKRDFITKSIAQKELILVDDIITTGETLTQAIDTLHKQNKEVLFCLTLSDMQNK